MKKTILFQGDSITDCNRFDDDGLGSGYVRIIHDTLQEYQVINKGISGNRSADLVARWNEDTIDLHPDVLSILVGVNDVWHRHYETPNGCTKEEYIENYTKILTQTKKELPNTKILMIQPYVVPVRDDLMAWRPELEELMSVCDELSKKYADAYLKLDDLMKDAVKQYGAEKLLMDGIHPTSFGHEFIASWVLKKIQSLL